MQDDPGQPVPLAYHTPRRWTRRDIADFVVRTILLAIMGSVILVMMASYAMFMKR